MSWIQDIWRGEWQEMLDPQHEMTDSELDEAIKRFRTPEELAYDEGYADGYEKGRCCYA